MIVVTIKQARDQFTSLLESVEKGGTVIITKNNKHIAEFRPINSREGFGKGKSKVKYNSRWSEMDLEIEGLFYEE